MGVGLVMFASMPKKVFVYEVGPRDGLQNEKQMVSTSDKIKFIDALSETGLPQIEITSFVSPRWIPQLADGGDVSKRIKRMDGVRYTALVPNKRGLDNALESGMKEVAVFLSSSETHNKKNVNKSIDDTLKAFDDVIEPGLKAGLKVRAYISTVFGCPYEGEVDSGVVSQLMKKLFDKGVYQVSLGDTIGVANPKQTEAVLSKILNEVSNETDSIAVHFHDTEGTALANCLVALSLGIRTVDSSIGGLGGCPYAPGASGNLATEDLVSMLHGMGIETGIDLDKLVECSRLAASFIGRDLPSKYLKAHLGKQGRARRQKEKTESNEST